MNVRKTKIIRFRKRGGRLEKRCWRWKGKEIEQVKEFCYLRYTLQRNGRQKAHIRDKKSGSGNGTGVGHWKKKVWRRLGKKAMDIWYGRC